MPTLDAQKLIDLHQKILQFNSDRGWDPSAQSIAKSVVIEAAELLEHFQWDSDEIDLNKKNLTEIGYEMSDVIWYLLLLTQKLDIDLVDALSHKLEHNEIKYPSAMFKGQHNEEYYYQQKRKYREEKQK